MNEYQNFTSDKESENEKEKKILKVLDKIYAQAIDGIPKISPSVSELANNYLAKNSNVNVASKKFINNQIAKCATSGFVTGLGGFATLPVAVPANVSNILYVQMRMIACLAYMAGYDTNCDQVQTLVYACLAGISIDQLVKNAGIQFGLKLTNSMVKKIPGSVLNKINQKVGFRFLTKFGTKGVINIGKLVPIAGGIIGGGFDLVETKIIADRAYKLFIKGDINALGKN